jgi:hypothetical protein
MDCQVGNARQGGFWEGGSPTPRLAETSIAAGIDLQPDKIANPIVGDD